MNIVHENALNFIKTEIEKAQIEVTDNRSGREGVDYIIKTNNGNSFQLFFQSIDFGTERSIKIPKQDLGKLNEILLIGLVLFLYL